MANSTKPVKYSMSDLPTLVTDGSWEECINVVKDEATKIKYGDVGSNSRKRTKLTNLRSTCYDLQRDMRADGCDTSEIRTVIKSLYSGGSY